MTTQRLTPPSQKKGSQTERQKRLGAALRENLRKRKSQQQERQNRDPESGVREQETPG